MIDKIVGQEGKKRKASDQYVALQLTLANVDNRVNTDEIYNFIEANLDNIQTYGLDPERLKDKYFAAAVDYTMLLSVAADVASLASLLWIAYDNSSEVGKFLRRMMQGYISYTRFLMAQQRPFGLAMSIKIKIFL
jgi:hypothetical protein